MFTLGTVRVSCSVKPCSGIAQSLCPHISSITLHNRLRLGTPPIHSVERQESHRRRHIVVHAKRDSKADSSEPFDLGPDDLDDDATLAAFLKAGGDEFDLEDLGDEELNPDDNPVLGEALDLGDLSNLADAYGQGFSAELSEEEVNATLESLEGLEDESATAARQAMEADASTSGDVEEDELDAKWPKPPVRAYFFADLLGRAAYLDAALEMEKEFPEVPVYGLQSDPDKVVYGDIYCCIPDDVDEVADNIQTAISNEATALILPSDLEMLKQQSPEWAEFLNGIPSTIPVIYVEAVDEVAARLGVAMYDAPSRELTVVAVAGSRGKTTVSWLIRGILEEVEQTTGMVGSIEHAIAEDRLDEDGDLWRPDEEDPAAEKESSVPFYMTPWQGRYAVAEATPSGLHLQKLLAGMRDRGASCAVVECSTQGLAASHCDWLEVTLAVHTNISKSETDRHGREAVLEAQLKLFEALEDPNTQGAVVNLDDPAAADIMRRCGDIPVVTYGIDNIDADVVAQEAKFTIWESEVIVKTPLGRLQIISSLLGKHNMYNILAAVAAGIALKVPLRAIVAGIEAVEIIPGRCEIIDEGQEFAVIVDAADTPEDLQGMLTALKDNAKNIYTVVGCRGDEDRSKRPYICEVAHNLSDVVIFTNDSPRSEDPSDIIQDMVVGLPDDTINRYSGYVYFPFQDQTNVPLWFEPYLQKAQKTAKRYVMEDRFSAIRAAIGTATKEDVVLILGRGHKDYMEYVDDDEEAVLAWFDDRQECRSALQKLTYLNQVTKLERKSLPWGRALEDMDTVFDPPYEASR